MDTFSSLLLRHALLPPHYHHALAPQFLLLPPHYHYALAPQFLHSAPLNPSVQLASTALWIPQSQLSLGHPGSEAENRSASWSFRVTYAHVFGSSCVLRL
ncbi:uncharacterized protein LACBIDRAFT_303089 [Laccaria bicolor S238N-H82]|uniref:Predicted protein n=1 Tax=Laccaria bicolor (strain S238N-H82 / ATCC MYA-4686) TaxID=486041 RepID=B0DIW9_LACBS|nr:uncharacterized protein LACBIDRAFT_303089 [Laccaria bicolor S238N-H82]EDR05305.1 predicted protein [Laccaria bicolor S238N-H82]|eukprot:XP_001883863.1 predicted protein [Laccaria bicolor S238N-H82]